MFKAFISYSIAIGCLLSGDIANAQGPLGGFGNPCPNGGIPTPGGGGCDGASRPTAKLPPKPKCPPKHVAVLWDSRTWVCAKDGKILVKP
jgi:hypothetical protein